VLCNRLLIEPSGWAQTVHTAFYVTRDSIFTPFVDCVFPLAFLRKGVRKGGGSWVKPSPFELDILQNFITCVKGINCFRILLVVNLST